MQVKQYLNEKQLTRSRTNHDVGVRVTYLKCSHNGCPKKLRLLNFLVNLEARHPYEIQEVVDTAHNHSVIIPRERGLCVQQKIIIDLRVERGQSAPKQVHLKISEKSLEKFLKKFIVISFRSYVSSSICMD